MSFASDTGYLPQSIDQIMDFVMAGVNEQFGTTYDSTTFVGTNYYKYFYAMAQRMQENEVKTSEIFLRMQEYFLVTNEEITRPNTTNPGIIDYLSAAGYLASAKAPADADAGKLFVCVDVVDDHARGNFTITSYANLVSGTDDSVTVGATVFTAQAGAATPGAGTFQAATSNALTAESLAIQINAHATAGALVEAVNDGAIVYLRAKARGTGGNAIALAYTDNDTNVGLTKSATTLLGGITADEDYDDVRAEICGIIKDCCVAGVISQGLEVETIDLPNNQSFDFKFALPVRTAITLKATITLSNNSQSVIDSDTVVAQRIFDNINARYRLGLDFEPQRYFSILDAPWASNVVLEYNTGSGFVSTVFEADFDDLFEFEVTDITVVTV